MTRLGKLERKLLEALVAATYLRCGHTSHWRWTVEGIRFMTGREAYRLAERMQERGLVEIQTGGWRRVVATEAGRRAAAEHEA